MTRVSCKWLIFNVLRILGGVGSGKLSVGSCEMMLVEVVEGAGGGSGAGVYGFRRLQAGLRGARSWALLALPAA